MPQPDFYPANLGRAFPLRDSQDADSLSTLIANAMVRVRPGSGYRDGYDSVSVVALGQTPPVLRLLLTGKPADTVFVAISCDTAEMRDQALVFAAPRDSSRYVQVTGQHLSMRDLQSAVGMPVTSPAAEVKNGLWDGWLALGVTHDFPTNVYTPPQPLPLEPTRVKNVAESAVNTEVGRVYVYNKQRTLYTDPEGCEHVTPSTSETGDDYVIKCGPLSTPVRIGGGSQVISSIQAGNGLITLLGEVDGGDLPRACETPALNSLEQPRNGFDYDGAPSCRDVLRRINGVDGPDLQVLARSGANVASFPDLNRVVVSLAGETLVSCPDYDDPQQVEYLPTNDDGIPCGNDGAFPPRPGSPDSDDGFTTVTTTTQGPTGTVDPINCGSGNCVWDWNGEWQLVSYPCESPCGCYAPDYAPATAESGITTSCMEWMPTSDQNPVRNSDFADDVPTAAWRILGAVELVYEYPGMADSEFPMLLMQEGASSFVQQRKVRVTPRRKYDLFADVNLVGGATVTFRVTNLSGDILLEKTVNDQTYRAGLRLGHFATTEDGVNLEVARPAGMDITGEALVSRITLLPSS